MKIISVIKQQKKSMVDGQAEDLLQKDKIFCCFVFFCMAFKREGQQSVANLKMHSV
jgi:hypothetical protein